MVTAYYSVNFFKIYLLEGHFYVQNHNSVLPTEKRIFRLQIKFSLNISPWKQCVCCNNFQKRFFCIKGIMILQAQSTFDSLSLMSFSVFVGSPVKDTVLTNDRWCDNGCKCHHGGTFTCTDRYNPGIVCSLAFCFTVYIVEHIRPAWSHCVVFLHK